MSFNETDTEETDSEEIFEEYIVSKFVQDLTMNFPDNQMLDPTCTCTLVSASISSFDHVICKDNE